MQLAPTVLLFYLYLVTTSDAVTYYVSASKGDDSRTVEQAKNAAMPWKTLQKAAATMTRGDVCVIHAGLYRETVTPAADEVTFQAREGEIPVISGCEPVSGWSSHQDKIYKAPVEQRVLALFEDGEHMQLARWPNEDGDPFSTTEWAACEARNLSKKGTGTAAITFTGTSWPANHWAGGHFLGYHGGNYYQANQGQITQSESATLTLTELSGNLLMGNKVFSGAGRGYIIQHLNALDVKKEWYWGKDTLYFQASDSGDPGKKSIEARVRLYGFDLSHRHHVTLKGIRFFASSVLMDQANDNMVDSCAFIHHAPWGNFREKQFDGISGERGQYEYAAKEDGTAGIFVRGSRNVIKNSYLLPGWGMGVHFRDGEKNKVENCLIENFNWLIKQDGAGVQVCGIGNEVSHCTIRNCSGMGVVGTQIGDFYVRGFNIHHNHISDTGKILLDSGTSAIYINNHNATDRNCRDAVIAWNHIGRVHVHKDNGKGMAIYMDDGNDQLTIHHNVIDAGGDIRWAIFSHGATHEVENFRVYHNTIWGYKDGHSSGGVVSSIRPKSKGSRAGLDVRNNVAQHMAYNEIHSKSNESGHGKAASNQSTVSAGEFVNLNAGNFQLKQGSPLVDAGETIAGINDGHMGSAPDLGAFESAVPAWTAGATLKGDPTTQKD